jgi:hypothetical protein
MKLFARLLLARLLIAGLPLATPLHAQDISVGLDIQTNAVVQLERGFDGSIWGITSSSMDLLPTVAGVFVLMRGRPGPHTK